MTRVLMAALIGLLGIIIGCAASEETNPLLPEYNDPTSDNRGSEDPSAPATMAIVEYGADMDYSDPATIEKYSKARILVVQAPIIWRDDINIGAIEAMKAANPDLKVVGYINAHTSWFNWGDDKVTDPDVKVFNADWYAATKPYWSYTTVGDTMTPWPGKVVLDILDPNCREAMVDVLEKHWNLHSNVLDGIFWDHFNRTLWVSDSVPGREGYLDLDGNGIAHQSDPDEIQAYRDASVALIQRTRQVLGDDVIQITNGNRAAMDSVFAGLVDGTMYENFPDVGFLGDRMRQALDLSHPNNLFAANRWARTQNGGPYQILSNTSIIHFQDGDRGVVQARKAEFNRVVALLTGGLVAYHSDDQLTRYGWPEIEVNLGLPVASAEFAGEVISREFENGRVTLDLGAATAGIPFGFEIEQNGEVIQSLAIPFNQD